MSDRAKKKERQRLKRQKKKLAMRRAQSVSPYKRIAAAGEVEACYINSDWQENGLATVELIRRNPQGGHALAVFLIDMWCAGLKDAWGHLDLMQEELDGHLDRAKQRVELIRIDVDLARQLVAGAIRFARQNGFRLPAHFDRWTNLLGGKIEADTADLSRFGKDGKLMWIGPLDDLRDRLIACTPEEFLQRPDVQFTTEVDPGMYGFDELFGDEDDDEDEEDELYEEESFQFLQQIARQMVRAMHEVIEPLIRQKLEEKGVAFDQTLSDAVLLVIVRDMMANYQGKDSAELSPLQKAEIESAFELLQERGLTKSPASQAHEDAVERIYEIWDEAVDLEEVEKVVSTKLKVETPRLRKQVLSTLHPTPQIPRGD
jgi:hypothetical protein